MNPRDFTLKSYNRLLNSLLRQGFSFQTIPDFIEKPGERVIVLRHDVDKLPGNSLEFARIQSETGIRGTYYFRIVPDSFDEKIIKEIYSLGHEVGYHYEDVSLAAKRQKTKVEAKRRPRAKRGVKRQKYNSNLIIDLHDRKIARLQDKGRLEKELADIAIESFAKNLQRLREIAPVRTICMHGSPMSRWDSRLLWKYYDYRDFGIVGEPYFDVNFDEVLYLTDTGRRWDGDSVNIRDKAVGKRDLVTKRLSDEGTKSRLSVSQSFSPLVSQSLSPSVFPAPRTQSPHHPFFSSPSALRPPKL